MALNPRIWFPIAAIGSLVNVLGAAFAAGTGEPMHAMLHAGLAVAAGVWAQRLNLRRAPPVSSTQEDDVAELRDAISALSREMSELQERVDFVERVLSQAREMDRLPNREPKQ